MIQKLYFTKHKDVSEICDLLDLEPDYVHQVLERNMVGV